MPYSLLVFVTIALTSVPRFSPLAESIDVRAFYPLHGCWVSEQVEPVSLEYWFNPTPDTMIGMSQTIRGGENVWYEFMRISKTETGDIFYTAAPSGQTPTEFRLVSFVNGQAVFENAEHDFPQFVIYLLPDGGVLNARFEGTVDGENRIVDFVKQRAPSCLFDHIETTADK